MRTEIELAWLIGLFEGEGCISLKHPGRLALKIAMTDEDVVRRAHAVAGCGRVSAASTPQRAYYKPAWVWTVGRCDEAAALLEIMLPLFGARRAAKGREALESFRTTPLPRRLRATCPHGHPYSGPNLRYAVSRGLRQRRCRECERRASRDYDRRQRAKAVAS